MSMIDINYLKQLLEIFDESSANDLRIEQEGTSIKLSKNPPHREVTAPAMQTFAYPPMQMTPQSPQHTHAAAAVAAVETPAANGAPVAEAPKYHEIRSPIVGTFYRAPSPDTPSFTDAGQEVSPGQVLCIIEAMKLMNEIECDVYGKVIKVLVENAQPVEYNQVLFLIDPS